MLDTDVRRQTCSFVLDADLVEWLRQRATRTGATMSGALRAALRELRERDDAHENARPV